MLRNKWRPPLALHLSGDPVFLRAFAMSQGLDVDLPPPPHPCDWCRPLSSALGPPGGTGSSPCLARGREGPAPVLAPWPWPWVESEMDSDVSSRLCLVRGCSGLHVRVPPGLVQPAWVPALVHDSVLGELSRTRPACCILMRDKDTGHRGHAQCCADLVGGTPRSRETWGACLLTLVGLTAVWPRVTVCIT